jgi:hypothetical protein
LHEGDRRGQTFPVLDGKPDETKISVDEDRYLRIVANADLPPLAGGS